MEAQIPSNCSCSSESTRSRPRIKNLTNSRRWRSRPRCCWIAYPPDRDRFLKCLGLPTADLSSGPSKPRLPTASGSKAWSTCLPTNRGSGDIFRCFCLGCTHHLSALSPFYTNCSTSCCLATSGTSPSQMESLARLSLLIEPDLVRPLTLRTGWTLSV